MAGLSEEEVKRALEQAIEKWLDKKFSQFGKWTVGALLASGLAAVGYFIVWASKTFR